MAKYDIYMAYDARSFPKGGEREKQLQRFLQHDLKLRFAFAGGSYRQGRREYDLVTMFDGEPDRVRMKRRILGEFPDIQNLEIIISIRGMRDQTPTLSYAYV